MICGKQAALHMKAEMTISGLNAWKEWIYIKAEKSAGSAGRNSSIELMRMIAMIMVVMYHIVCHCVGVQISGGNSYIRITSNLFNQPLFSEKLTILGGIMAFGPIANGIFLLISGYFTVKKGSAVNLFRIARKLLLQLGFASIVLVFASTFLYRYDGANHIHGLFNINSFNSMSWYAGYYFLVMVIAVLFLNDYLLECGRQKYSVFLMVLFAMIQFSWSGSLLDQIGSGLRIAATGVFFYALGGYIRIYNPFKRIRTIVLFLIPAAAGVLIYFSAYNSTQNYIEEFYLQDPNGTFIQTLMSYENYGIIVIILAVCMFEFFTRIQLPQSKVINYFGQGVFMVYLIHDNPLFYSIWGQRDWGAELYYTPLKFLCSLLGWSIATFILGIMAYTVYLGIGKLYPRISWLFLKKEEPSRDKTV